MHALFDCQDLLEFFQGFDLPLQNLFVQAMHRICLAQFERDKAMGGDMYARFAGCYLKNTGNHINLQHDQLGQHTKEHAEEALVTADMAKVSKRC